MDNLFLFQWLFPSRSAKDLKWDYKKELAKSKKLSLGKSLPTDANYDPATAPMDNDIEHMIFPTMDKGTPMTTMDEAQRLEQELVASNVTKPVFPTTVWDVSSSWQSMLMNMSTLISLCNFS